MSEFEKQFPKPPFPDDGGMNWFIWHNQKKGWLAALKWAMEHYENEYEWRQKVDKEIADVEQEIMG